MESQVPATERMQWLEQRDLSTVRGQTDHRKILSVTVGQRSFRQDSEPSTVISQYSNDSESEQSRNKMERKNTKMLKQCIRVRQE